MRRFARWALVLVLAGWTFSARAEDPPPPPHWPVGQFSIAYVPARITPETLTLIRELTADEYPRRALASRALAEKGAVAYPGLQDAVWASQDPELAARTALFLPQGTFRLPPALPARTAAMAHQYEYNRPSCLAAGIDQASEAESMLQMLLLGHPESRGELGELFFRIALEQESDATMRAKLQKATANRAALKARLAIAEGKFDDAQRILQAALSVDPQAARDYAALVALRNGPAFNPQRELGSLQLEGRPPYLRDSMAVLLYRAAGDSTSAVSFAPGVRDPLTSPARLVLLEARRLEDLARYADSMGATYPFFLDTALARRLGGHPEHLDDILATVLKRADSGASINPLNLNYFLVQDRAADAINITQRLPNGQSIAFDLLCRQLRIREALATITDRKNIPLSIPRRLLDLGFIAPARDLLLQVQPGEAHPAGSPAAFEFELASLLELAGEPGPATRWRNRAFEIADAGERQTIAIRSDIRKIDAQLKPLQILHDAALAAQQLDLLNRRSLLIKQLPEKSPPPFDIAVDPRLTTEESRIEAVWWFDLLRSEPLASADCCDKTFRILAGKISDEEAASLMDEVLNAATPDYTAQWNSLSLAANRFHQMHREDSALALVSRWFQREKDPSCWAILADQFLEQGQFAKAAENYQRAALVNLTDASLMFRLGLALSHDPVTHAAGEQLIAYAPFLVLGDDAQALRLAQAMRRFQSPAEGNRWFDSHISRFTTIQDYIRAESLRRTASAAESRGEYTTALELQKQALFSPPPHFPMDFSEIMVNFALLHRSRALDAWSRRDFPTLADALDKQLNNGPPDVDLLQKTLPALKTADGPAAAHILDRALTRLRPIVQDYFDQEKYRSDLQKLEALTR